KSFIIESKRVYTITKKPSNEEFKVIVKVTALGILLIGLLGFIIHIIAQIL
ncbi:protein translocase SEC61 complex subunit gamma, partial [Candidatus Woesearchaeota archaeon]|nr:protein translocase SEC61 complex subunit gamma [Candidatus Woesearchaeota archaeon]